MNPAVVELAKLFKDRENSNQESFVIGKVVSPYPKLLINDGDDILLGAENLIVSAHLLPYSRTYATGETSGTIRFTDSLKVGEQVVMLPSKNEQKYLIIDKVVTL